MQIAINITHNFDTLEAFADFAERIKVAFADLKSAGAKLATTARAPVEPLPLPAVPVFVPPAPAAEPASAPADPSPSVNEPAPADTAPKRKPGRPRKADSAPETPAAEPAPAPVAESSHTVNVPEKPASFEGASLADDVAFRAAAAKPVNTLLAKHGHDGLTALLSEFGARRPLEVPAERRAEFLARVAERSAE